MISPWELSVVRRIDQAVLAVINKTGSQKREATERDAAATKQSIRSAMKNRRVVKVSKSDGV